MVQVQAREDLKTLLNLLPASIREPLEELGREDELLEVVMDLGRPPTAPTPTLAWRNSTNGWATENGT